MFKPLLSAVVLGALTTGASAQSPPEPSTPTAPSEPVKLQLKLPQDQSYTTRVRMEQKISQTIQGKRMDISTDMTMGMTMKVKEVNADGTMSVDTRYTSLAMTTSGAMDKQKFTMSYDSTRPSKNADPNLKMLGAMLNQSLTLKMAPNGEVKEIQGLDKMWKNMVAKMPVPKGVSRAQHQQSMNALKEQFGEKNFRNMTNSMAVFPANVVNIGESWSKTSKMDIGFPVSSQAKYTLQSVENGVATIGISAALKMASGASPAVAKDDIKFDMNGTQTGKFTVDTITGWTESGDISYRFSGRISTPDPTQRGKTISWPVYMKGTATIETVRGPGITQIKGNG